MVTCEFVSAKHPDKQCDVIADTILDAYLKNDPKSRVAIEVMGGHNHITVSGEVTSVAEVDIEKTVQSIVGSEYKVSIFVSEQSPFISQGVDIGGAGDQGIMVGYATNETETMMPLEYETARTLCAKIYERYPFDGKVQVTLNGLKSKTVVASFQNVKSDELKNLVKSLVEADEYLINPAGEWMLGGFDADSGLSGRKIVIDSYGPSIPVGGGSFSGKDPTKVDRSAAYMARLAAKNLVSQGYGEKCWVTAAYAIGKAEPVMLRAWNETNKDLTEILKKKFDFRPQAIIERLDLRKPIYASTASFGHFGRKEFSWEKIQP